MGRLFNSPEQLTMIRAPRPRSSSEPEMSSRRDDQPYKSLVLPPVRIVS